ncbi:small ribosomal subunit protein uS5m-like isoform X2 [Ictidomys tridecemlineatus]
MRYGLRRGPRVSHLRLRAGARRLTRSLAAGEGLDAAEGGGAARASAWRRRCALRAAFLRCAGVSTGHFWCRQLSLNTFPTASVWALKTTFSNGPLSLQGTRDSRCFTSLSHALQTQCCISPPTSRSGQQYTPYSFFTKLTADELWKGALAETGAGARKGRGKRSKKKRRKDLNRGQVIGEETYEDFDTRILEVRNVFNMTAKDGRKRSVRVLVAVGNGQGAAGFAIGKATERVDAFRKAKNKAIHYLHYIERYEDHTIFHDISLRYKRTHIKMKKQPRGYGLRCHRAIITICRLIGIKDMYVKVSGSVNMLNLTRGLFHGLSRQETHQQLADKKGLHVVEFREECGPLPILVASPRGALRKDPEPEEEVPDIRLDWEEVKATQGMKRSIWSDLKRAST